MAARPFKPAVLYSLRNSAVDSNSVFQSHSRQFEYNRFVYPVVSRRSQGVSVGVNLNPDKVCNFDCIYCQVNRRSESETKFVGTEQLMQELQSVLQLVQSGELYDHPKFESTPANFRRLNDIAFSGDGEPTTFRNFEDIIQQAAQIKQAHAPVETKMVLITNASMLHRSHVQRGLAILDQNQGEIWAKLDAGTQSYYELIERTRIPFQQILDNILMAAQSRPIVIQSLFMAVHGDPPSNSEIEAFAGRLHQILEKGGRLKLVQIYTVARPPAESFVASLSVKQLQQIAEIVQKHIPTPVAIFP